MQTVHVSIYMAAGTFSAPYSQRGLPPFLFSLSLSLSVRTLRGSMLLRASSSALLFFSSPASDGAASIAPSNPWNSGTVGLCRRTPRTRPAWVAMASGDVVNRVLAGVVFEPFEEVKKELALVPSAHHESLARQNYVDDCEAAINDQINIEYNVSYVYHAMFGYFDRDNVALKGLAKFFKESSEEEREHAEKLMEYQNKRGGKVKLQSILMPLNDYGDDEKGDALYAMELALSLEKLVNEKLLNLHGVARRVNDVEMASYIENEFLWEQVEAIKRLAEYVAQLRRVGKGHGVWHFDQMLLHEGDNAV